ncbi:MAG: PASTA domain-containing protein [Coriobacteriales bacterium]|nr:PASTA domain-containing protein [Coriobacteriales bacterium]
MSFCTECGAALQAEAHFCSECGAAQTIPDSVGELGDAAPADKQPLAVDARRRVVVAIIATAAIVILVAALAFVGYRTSQRQAAANAVASSATVPDLRGLTASQARKKLKAVGLIVGNVDYDPEATGALGAIVRIQPAPGARVKQGTTVALTVVGEQPVKVPNFKGLTTGGAKAAAAAVGLKVAVIERKSSRKRGTVISQSPKKGETAQPGSAVNITVSKGRPSIKKGKRADSDGVYSPAKGSAERTAIMDACRIHWGYDGLWRVNELKVRSSRAYANLTPDDDPGWGFVSMYLMKSGGGWIVSSDSRTGSTIEADDWLLNR